MTALFALLRKHFIESRWVLGLCSGAFFGLSVLTVWITSRIERAIAAGEMADEPRRFGFLRGLGGAAMDYSTTAIEICWWNHPVIVLTLLSWAVTRGSNAVAGEIERGTIDLAMSRPVPRWQYLASHVLFAVFGLVTLVAALIVGNLVGTLCFTLKAPPSLLTLLKPGLMFLSLGLAVFGYTVPLSAVDVVRWRPTLISCTVTLAGLIGMSVATQLDGFGWLEHLSVFNLYAPVTVALKGEPLVRNVALLAGVFVIGTAAAFAGFARRDLPSNS